MKEFKFWCQKVLPLVYDDSLSYYELLCKVVDYLNKLSDSLNNTNEQIMQLAKEFNELKNYIDNYFDELDVQTEVNNKIQQLQESGYFEHLINVTKFNELSSSVNKSISDFENSVNKSISAFENSVNKTIDSIQLGSPSGSFSNYEELQSTHPRGASGFYIVNGNWYYWNGEEWANGGIWNAAVVGKHSIEPINIKGSNVFEYTSRDKLIDNSFINDVGVITSYAGAQRYVVDITPNGYVMFIGQQQASAGLFAFLNGDNVVSTFSTNSVTKYDIDVVRIIMAGKEISNSARYNNLIVYVIKAPSNANKFSVNGYINESFPDFRDITWIGDFDLNVLINLFFGYSDIFNEERGKAYITSLSNNSKIKLIDGMSYFYDSNGTYIRWKATDFYMTLYPMKAGETYSFARKYGRSGYGDIVLWNADGTIEIINPDDLSDGLSVLLSDGLAVTSKLITPSKDCILTCSTGTYGGTHRNQTLDDTFIGKPLYANFPTTPYIQTINDYALLPSNVNLKNSLEGAKITVIGDSITEKNYRANTNWVDLFTNMGAKMQNLGLSSSGFKSLIQTTGNIYSTRISQINSDVELIGVSVSFNDYKYFDDLGTIYDTLSDGTLYGYVNDFFDKLINAFPTVPIICYTTNPWATIYYGGTNTLSVQAKEYLQGISEICANRGIAFLSLFHNTSLMPWIEANNNYYFDSDGTRSPDGIHPNSKGHQILFRHYLPFFMENYRTPNDFYI